jgi:hypothetical protein
MRGATRNREGMIRLEKQRYNMSKGWSESPNYFPADSATTAPLFLSMLLTASLFALKW